MAMRFAFVLSLFVISFVAACGDDDPAGGGTVNLDIQVTNILSNEAEPDTEVCVIRPSMGACATADAMGDLTLAAPAMADVAIRYTKAEFWPLIHMVTTNADHSIEADIANNIAVNVAAAGAMMSPEAGKGQLLVQLAEPEGANTDLAGATVSLSTGAPPLYFGEDQIPDAALTETTDLGLTAFINLDPGEYEVTIAHPSVTCSYTESGWLTDSQTTVRVLIEPDSLTTAAFLECQ